MTASVVVHSLRQLCAVCRGHGRVELVVWEGHVSTCHTTANCPHCSNYQRPVPIVELLARVDIPRGAA